MLFIRVTIFLLWRDSKFYHANFACQKPSANFGICATDDARARIVECEAGLRFYKIRFYKIKNPNTRISTHIHYYIHTIVLYLVETKACRMR